MLAWKVRNSIKRSFTTPCPGLKVRMLTYLKLPRRLGYFVKLLIALFSCKYVIIVSSSFVPTVGWHGLQDQGLPSPLPGACIGTWRWTLRFHFSINGSLSPGVILPGQTWPSTCEWALWAGIVSGCRVWLEDTVRQGTDFFTVTFRTSPTSEMDLRASTSLACKHSYRF